MRQSLVLACALALSACDAESDDPSADGGPSVGVSASSQALALSTAVVVDEVFVEGDAWLTVREDLDGEAGGEIGIVGLSPGAHHDVEVTLRRPAVDGETLWAVLHEDDGVIGQYEFPAADPQLTIGHDIVAAPFLVDVPIGTPAVRIHVLPVGMVAWEIESTEPALYRHQVAGHGENPSLSLMRGWRYEIMNPEPEQHPFEIIVQGATADLDEELLSQEPDEIAELETDPSVMWTSSDTTIAFTASPALTEAADGYRCGVHSESMRGELSFEG